MNYPYSDDSFHVNTYQFYFLNGIHRNGGLHLYGKLKYQGEHYHANIIIRPASKTVLAQVKQGRLPNKEDIEYSLKPYTKNLTSYESELVRKRTCYNGDNEFETFLQIQYNAEEKFHFDADRISEESCIEFVYGQKDDVLEQFLMRKGIKGPCWLHIETFSDHEILSRPTEISCNECNIRLLEMVGYDHVPDTPSFIVVFLEVSNIPTKHGKVEPVLITVSQTVWNGNTFSGTELKILSIDKSSTTEYEEDKSQIQICSCGRDLLEKLREILGDFTDIVICPNKSFLHYSNAAHQVFHEILIKYPLIDLQQYAREFFPDLVGTIDNLFQYFLQTTATSQGMERATNFIRLTNEMNVISTYLLIVEVVGCQLIDAPTCSRMKRVEYLLKHEFYRQNVVVPEKRDKSRPLQETICGGDVLTPSIGVFPDLSVAYDFKSLYPSVICEFNIDFFNGEQMVLPNIMIRLQSQRETMSLRERNEASNGRQISSRSSFLKELANSIVGCLASQHCLFYHPLLANSVTQYGRMLLGKIIKEIPNKMTCIVVYGHTDSVFVVIKGAYYEDVLEDARAFQEEFNSRYRYVRLKLEGIFSNTVIFGKQMYALQYHDDYPKELRNLLRGYDYETELPSWVIRGAFRKDTPKICHQLFKYVLERIVSNPLNSNSLEFVEYTKQLLKSDNLEDYTINIQLKQCPSSYNSDLPYVNIVKRNNLRSCSPYLQFDWVLYVLCEDGTKNKASKRAYDLNEIRLRNLQIDKNYYKTKYIRNLYETMHSVAPKYIDLVKIKSFLKAGNVLPAEVKLPLSVFYQKVHISLFHFQCLQCFEYVILKNTYVCIYFIHCPHCKEKFRWPEQAEEICKRVEKVIKNAEKYLEHMKLLADIKCEKNLVEIAESKLFCSDLQFYKQLELWKNVVIVASLDLDSAVMHDAVKAKDEYYVKNLFNDVLNLIEAALQKHYGKCKDIIKLSDYF